MRWRAGPRGRWAALVLAVLLLHALVLGLLRERLAPLTPRLQRLEAVYARQVQIAAVAPAVQRAAPPPAAAPRPRRAPKPRPVPPPAAPAPAASAPAAAASAASAPEAIASAASDPMLPLEVPDVKTPVEPPTAVASASAPGSSASSAAAAASVPAMAASTASAPAGTAFEWPLSTRIQYRLTGWYRGEITGHAQVEWVRRDDRYQVHLDVDAGVVSRRMTSDGRITDAGLLPQRYEEVTKVLLAAPRVRQMRFDDERVTLASGETAPRPGRPGDLQDTASQFIQMIFAFSTRADLLRPGAKLAMQLALPHRVRPVLYEVGALEWVEAPGGKGWLEAWPVRPRIAPEASSGRDLQVETWLAPRLQMLPVRIRIQQDADNYLDLRIEQLPEQAAAPPR